MSEDKPISSGSNEWLSDMDLTARGFPTAEIRSAIVSGELAGQMFATTAFVVKAGDLADWLENRKSKPGSTTVNFGGGRVTVPAGLQPGRSESTQPPTSSSGSHADRFRAEIETRVAGGMSRARATCAVVMEFPALHAAVLSEANSRAALKAPSQSPRAVVQSVDPTVSGGSHAERFRAEIEQRVASGMSRAQATSAVVKELPALHAAVLAEANGRRQSA